MNPQALKLTAEFQEATRPKTLAEIAAEIMELASTVDENGELTKEAAAQLDKINLSLERKVEGYAVARAHLLADAKACKEVAKQYDQRAQARENAAERLCARLQLQMAQLGTTRIKTPTITASIQESPKRLVITGPVSAKYLKQVLEVDKDAIKADLDAGETIEHAHYERGTHLRFR